MSLYNCVGLPPGLHYGILYANILSFISEISTLRKSKCTYHFDRTMEDFSSVLHKGAQFLKSKPAEVEEVSMSLCIRTNK